jgi:hypothetical protein
MRWIRLTLRVPPLHFIAGEAHVAGQHELVTDAARAAANENALPLISGSIIFNCSVIEPGVRLPENSLSETYEWRLPARCFVVSRWFGSWGPPFE